MKLSVLERLTLIDIQPSHGKMSEMRQVRQFVDKVKILEEEGKAINLRAFPQPDGGFSHHWDGELAEVVDIEFTPAEVAHMKKCVTLQDTLGRVTSERLDLFDRILALEVPNDKQGPVPSSS